MLILEPLSKLWNNNTEGTIKANENYLPLFDSNLCIKLPTFRLLVSLRILNGHLCKSMSCLRPIINLAATYLTLVRQQHKNNEANKNLLDDAAVTTVSCQRLVT